MREESHGNDKLEMLKFVWPSKISRRSSKLLGRTFFNFFYSDNDQLETK